MTTSAMFCYQCEEAAKNEACTIRGVCGKKPDVANIQYLALHVAKGMAFWNSRARELDVHNPEISHHICKILFATITNGNFDVNWFIDHIKSGIKLRDNLKDSFFEKYQQQYNQSFSEPTPEIAIWELPNEDPQVLNDIGKLYDPLRIENEDIRSLSQLIFYGLKGMAAYADHALTLGYEDDDIWSFMEETLVKLIDPKHDVDELLELTMKTGEIGVKTMSLLDEANTSTFGHPSPTKVDLGVNENPGILISGHDLLDLKELLEQTEGTGIDIYTHGEMLPANAYPELKKYDHLKGNYGGSWFHQKKEFESFNGPILMTTNCLVPPKDSYKDRVYVTGTVGYPDLQRIPERKKGQQKDFSAVIEHAKQCQSPEQLETGDLDIGFARQSVLNVADTVVKAIKDGTIRRFVVMGGCDGRKRDREYFTEVAKKLPDDTIILTAGCAKYRYNKLNLGTIAGVPRILDAGQCNDNYSLVVIASKLAEVLEKESINDLPISFDIGWYEQKAVLVLLALLHLNVKNIRIGPTLPAFLSQNVTQQLVDKFGLQLTSDPESDIQAMLN